MKTKRRNTKTIAQSAAIGSVGFNVLSIYANLANKLSAYDRLQTNISRMDHLTYVLRKLFREWKRRTRQNSIRYSRVLADISPWHPHRRGDVEKGGIIGLLLVRMHSISAFVFNTIKRYRTSFTTYPYKNYKNNIDFMHLGLYLHGLKRKTWAWHDKYYIGKNNKIRKKSQYWNVIYDV